jgi:hypothetical protein
MQPLTTANIERYLRLYLEGAGTQVSGRHSHARYASFDYCYNYFQTFREQQALTALDSPANLQTSCLQLGFYLASWGMLRGSSFLLQKSVPAYAPVITAIAHADPALWEIDAHCYTPENIERILAFRKVLAQALENDLSDTLFTKIMLGVFANVPAFDSYFKTGFKVSTFSKSSLEKIGHFYNANASVIEKYRVKTLDFNTGAPTQRLYSRAKVIDMLFFIAGSPSG